MAVWDDFESIFDTEIQRRKPGYLFLARTNRTAAQFRENVSRQNKLGVPSTFITPETARRYCPELKVDNYVGATYSPTDGFADPHLALQGFASAATEQGVTMKTGVEVTGLIETDGSSAGIGGVKTEDGTFTSEYVVNAAGPWAADIASMAGIDIPVFPRRRQLLIADPSQPVPETGPMVADLDSGVHFRPERKGAAVVGGHFDSSDPDANPDTYSKQYDLDWAVDALEHAAECANYFGPDTKIKQGWAGLYSATPDHHPIIDEIVPGFVNAVGFSGHGFMQAPATGRVVADLVSNGKTTLVDISVLTAARFERGELLEEGTVLD
jgi:sarcosine oxidase subunit beta